MKRRAAATRSKTENPDRENPRVPEADIAHIRKVLKIHSKEIWSKENADTLTDFMVALAVFHHQSLKTIHDASGSAGILSCLFFMSIWTNITKSNRYNPSRTTLNHTKKYNAANLSTPQLPSPSRQ